MIDIVIAAAGTGGHIYPGIAVAQHLQRLSPQKKIMFLGSPRGLEGTIVPRYGFPVSLLPAYPIKGISWWGRIMFVLLVPWMFFKALLFFIKNRPRVCFGTGAYASAIPLRVAAFLRIPVVLFESNAQPGLTNRWLARSAKKVFVQFEDVKKKLPGASESIVECVSMPTREQSAAKTDKFFKFPAKSPNRKHIVVLGGSQGARRVNEVISKFAPELVQKHHMIVVHQTGAAHFNAIHELHRQQTAQVQAGWVPVEYIENMADAYSWADLFVCRAGASTLAELEMYKMPSILVPFPFATDDHQMHNAKAFETRGVAAVIPEKELEATLIQKLDDFSENQLKSMKNAFTLASKHSNSGHSIAAYLNSF